MASGIRKVLVTLTAALLSHGAAIQAQPSADAATLQNSEALVPIRNIFGLRTAMRDGVKLVSDVWLPKAPGKYPVILIRTPYIRSTPQHAELGEYFARRGYAFVVQDARGRGDSEGKFEFYANESRDGYDAIEALAQEPWANGRVCTMGNSYLGTVQWLAARERPPHLACIAPSSPSGEYHNEVPTVGGAFMLYWAISWMNMTSDRISQAGSAAKVDWPTILQHRPLITMDEALGRRMPMYREMLEHDTFDSYWQHITLTEADFRKIEIPIMATTGWFDGDQMGQLYNWNGIENRGARAPDQFLVVGPWTHGQTFGGGSEKLGVIPLAKNAIIDNKAVHLAFFNRYLKQSAVPLNWPRVQLYVSGLNQWRSFDQFPVPTTPTRLYLSSGGKANTLDGDGTLSWERPARQPSDKFSFDPRNPVPLTYTGPLFGTDRRDTQKRQDVLVYTSSVLKDPVEVIGRLAVELYAATDGRDTDFTAAISDVFPDGTSALLGSKPVGILRGRYRNGRDAKPSLLTPNKPELFRIDLGHIGHRFLPGHRIRVEISSSAYPMFNPNQNTGNPIATDVEWRTAKQSIFHDTSRPSALVLPVYSPK